MLIASVNNSLKPSFSTIENGEKVVKQNLAIALVINPFS